MPESYWNENSTAETTEKQEIFSQLRTPPETPIFVRLNGRRFQAVSQKLKTQKPFDRNFAKCLVKSGKALFQASLNSLLIYVASDEINTLFLHVIPFGGRVEKINSVLAGTISGAFCVNALKHFKKTTPAAFDSRIVTMTSEKIKDYLASRQRDAWRNHNNIYAYWLMRKQCHRPSEAAKILKGLKTKELHELLFQQGINLAKTPVWQRRGVLIYRQPYQKHLENLTVTRWCIQENWNLPLFTSTDGRALLKQILEWTKPSTISEV